MRIRHHAVTCFLFSLMLILSMSILSGCRGSVLPAAGTQQTDTPGADIKGMDTTETDAADAAETDITKTEQIADKPAREPAQDPAEESKKPYESAEKPEERGYIYRNGINYFEDDWSERVDQSGEIQYPYVQLIRIDGLKDNEIQDMINQCIIDESQALMKKEPPPYRGIYASMRGEKVGMVYLASHVNFNESNLLSVVLTKLAYTTDGALLFEDKLPLTFDLNTGQQLSLEDLFSTGYDYQSAISEYVRDYIARNSTVDTDGHGYRVTEDGAPVTLLKPFDTVREEQKFTILSHNEIALLLDYETPEFEVGRSGKILTIYAKNMEDRGEAFVYNSKYETGDDSLYRNGFPRRKTLLEAPYDDNKSWWVDEAGFIEGYTDVWLGFSIIIPETLDNQELRERVNRTAEQAEERYVSFVRQQDLSEESGIHGNYTYWVAEFAAHLAERESSVIFTNTQEVIQHSFNLYELESGRRLSLEDCFKPGYDYQSQLEVLMLEESAALRDRGEPIDFTAVNFTIDTENIVINVLDEEGKCVTTVSVPFYKIGEEHLVFF